MARLDTRSIAEGVTVEWVLNDEAVELPDPCNESAEIREWRMIVAFLQHC